MLETSARLLELLSLLQSRAEWSGEQLAERLEVGVRTIRRDMERLRTLGYPVDSTPGVAGGYRLGAGGSLPPLLLDDEEAVAVAVGLRTAASVAVAGIEETSVRALAKLEHVLPSRLRRRVGAIGAATVPYPGSGSAAVDPEVLATIAGAWRDQLRLRFRYTGREGAATRRLVEPCRLVHTGWRWYLLAWDLDRSDWRTFRVDRIDGRLATDRRFHPREPPAKDIAAYVARRVALARDRHQVRVILDGPAAQMRRRVPLQHGTITALDDERCVLELGADWLPGVAVHIANIGVDFEVLEPPELRDEVARLAERFLSAAQRSTK